MMEPPQAIRFAGNSFARWGASEARTAQQPVWKIRFSAATMENDS